MTDKILTTLSELETKADTLKGQILLYDNQIHDQRNLIDNQSYTIGSNQAILETLKEGIVTKTQQKNDLLKDILTLEKERDNLFIDIEQSRKVFVSINSNITREESEHADKEAILSSKEIAVAVREEKVLNRENIAEEKEKELLEKHLKIKNLAKEL